MAIALVLAFGDRKRLLSKPAEYSDLIRFARKFFDQLEGVKDNEVTFQFTPEWGGAELELDESAFDFVHHRAELRIFTSKQILSAKAKRTLEPDGAQNHSTPDTQKKIKTGASMARPSELIDLTQPDHINPCLSASGQIIPVAEDHRTDEQLSSQHNQNSTPQQLQQTQASPEGLPSAKNLHLPDTESSTALRGDHAALVSSRADEPFQARNMAGRHIQRQALSQIEFSTGNQNSTASEAQTSSATEVAQHVSIGTLTAHNGLVDAASPTRKPSPCRQQIAEQWVNCSKPLTKSDGYSQHSVRVLTENHILTLNFRNENIYISTLLQHVGTLGYPIEGAHIRRPDDNWPFLIERHTSFGRSGVRHNSDLYVFNDARPGIYLLPSREDSSLTSHVRIKVHLVPGLKFRSLYPWTEIDTTEHGDKVEWGVSVDKRGDTVSKVNQETYYGHPSWDIAANSSIPCALQPNDHSPCIGHSAWDLTPDTSVVLSMRDMFRYEGYAADSSYIMTILLSQLQLERGTAKDFEEHFKGIIYRLSLSCERNEDDIAISFVPQGTLDKITTLEIEPEPAAIGRVWMIYSVVNTQQKKGRWSAWFGKSLSPSKALQKKNWAEIVGLDRKLKDAKTFRAIEWGVMEVPEAFVIDRTEDSGE